MTAPASEPSMLQCPLCRGTEFDRQFGKLDSKWGVTALKVDMRICRQCGYVMQFYRGRTFFGNFD